MHASLRQSSALSIAEPLLQGVHVLIRGPHDCELLGAEGIAVQVAITLVCAFSMIAVWLLEPVRRPLFVWAFDMSKQVFAAGYGKMWNIAQSIIFAQFLRGHEEFQDQCVWYLMSITIDCLFLTFLCWGLTSLTRPILLNQFQIDIGDYESYEDSGDESEMKHILRSSTVGEKVYNYLEQLGIWIGIITVCRLVISVFLFFTQHQVYRSFASVFPMLGLETSTQKLIFSVLVWPFFADTFQIVVQDSFLKKNRAVDVS